MADTTLFAHRSESVDCSPVRMDESGHPWVVVRLHGEATEYFIAASHPRAVERAEDFARMILAGCAAVREAQARKWNHTLALEPSAPDPVNIDDMASTELRPRDIQRGLRTWQPDPAA